MEVASLQFQMAADVARLAQDMRKAEGVVSGAARHMQQTLDMVTKAMGLLGVGIGGAGLAAWIKSAVDAADATSKLAQKIGVATEEVAGLQLAYRLAGAGPEALQTSISRLSKGIVDGNLALRAMGIETKTASGEFRSTTAVLYDVADAFATMGPGIQRTALAVEIFGKSGADLLPLLAGGSEGFREMAAMAEKLGLSISAETAKQAESFNDTLDLIGQSTQGVARRVAAQLLPTLQSLAGNFFEAMTKGDGLRTVANLLAGTFKTLYTAGALAGEVFATVGKAIGATASQIVLLLRGEWSAARQVGLEFEADMKRGWTDTIASITKAWNDEGGAAVAAAAKVAKVQQDMLAAAKAREEAGKAAAAAAKKEADELAKLLGRLRSREAGISPDFVANMKLLQRAWEGGSLALEEYLKRAEQLVREQPYMVAAEKERAKVLEGAQKSAERFAQAKADSDANAEAALLRQIADLQREAETFGRLESAVGELTLARMLDARAAAVANGEDIGSLDRQIVLRQKLNELIRAREARDAERKAAEESAKATEREQQAQLTFWSRIEDVAQQTFVSIFDSGKSAFERLRDTLKNTLLALLYEMTAKKWLISIGTSMGIPGAALAQTGSNLLGSATASALGSWLAPAGGMVDSVLGLFGAGSGIAGAAVTGAEIAATAAATESALLAAGATATEAAAAAAALGEAAAATAGAAGSLTSVLAAIPGWGWALAAAAAIFAMSGSKGGPKIDGRFGWLVSDIGAPGQWGANINGGDPALSTVAMQSVAGLTAQFEGLARSIGLVNTGINFGIGISTDPSGESPTFLDFTASRNGASVWHSLNREIGRSQQELTDALQRMGGQALIGALQGMTDQLPRTIAKMIEGVNTSALSTEGAAQIVQQIKQVAGAVTEFGKVAEALPFEDLRDLGFDAAAALLEANGGLEKFAGNLATYYAQFFTEEERRLNVARQIQQALAGAGLNLSVDQILGATREQFRGLVDTLETGSPLWNALIGVSGAFASIVPATQQAAEAIGDVVEEIKKLTVADVQELFMSDAEIKAMKARNIAAQFNAATGANVDADFVLGLSREEFRGYFMDFFAAGNTVVTQALIDIAQPFASITPTIDEANKALGELPAVVEEVKRITVADVQSLFLTASENRAAVAAQIAGQFNAATGLNLSPDFVLGLDRQDFRGYFMTFFEAGNTVVTQAMLDVAELFASITPEIDAAAEALRALQAEGRSLDVQILEATGDIAAARQLLREIETAGMTPEQIAQYDINRGKQDQLDAIRKQAAIDGQVLDFQIRYYQLLGDETKARELLLSKMDPALQEWQKQIWILEDAAEAERKRTAAMEEQKRAAEALRQSLMGLANGMFAEADRTRGLLIPQSREGLAQLQAQFAILNAQARSGNQSAAGQLAGLNQQIIGMAQGQLSGIELSRLIAQQAFSLEQTGFGLQALADPQTTELKEVNRRLASIEARMVEGNGFQKKTADTSEYTLNNLRDIRKNTKDALDIGVKVKPSAQPIVTTTSS